MSENGAQQIEVFRKAAEACVSNATELVEAARKLSVEGVAPRIPFHLAVIGLEEIGKAELLRMAIMSLRYDHEIPTLFSRSIDDHVKKLFWATWGPAISHGQFERKDFDAYQKLASRIHSMRLQGMYVDISQNKVMSPESVISSEAANDLITLADDRLRRMGASTSEEIPPEQMRLVEWFLDATEHSERQQAIFSTKSRDKLAELKGDTHQWILWLKQWVEDSEKEAQETLQRELARQRSTDATAQERYELTLRLYTFTHSIRGKLLAPFGKGTWINLQPIANQKDQLLVKMKLTDRVALGDVFDAGMNLANMVVASINIGSLGYFFYFLPPQPNQYHTKSIDLVTKKEFEMLRPNPLRPDYERVREVLDEGCLSRTGIALGVIGSLGDTEREFLGRYVEGLVWLSKSDVHLDLSHFALSSFYRAFEAAIPVFDPTATATSREIIQTHLMAFGSLTEDEVERMLDDGAAGKKFRRIPMERALNMKLAVDRWLTPKFRERLKLKP